MARGKPFISLRKLPPIQEALSRYSSQSLWDRLSGQAGFSHLPSTYSSPSSFGSVESINLIIGGDAGIIQLIAFLLWIKVRMGLGLAFNSQALTFPFSLSCGKSHALACSLTSGRYVETNPGNTWGPMDGRDG